MRKVIVSNIVSLDGYYTGPGGNVMVLPMDHFFDTYNAERLRAADTLLLGRTSFEMFRGYWPAVEEDPEASPANREISRLNSAMEKIVISDSLTIGDADPWQNSRVVSRADAHPEVGALRQEDGNDILVFGSHTMWTDLLAVGLVDELHLMVGNTIAGDGIRVFDGQPPVSFHLLDTSTAEGSGNVVLRYAVRPHST